jgi:hypothetical protein
MIKKILVVLLVILVGIQFIRPDKNISADSKHEISRAYTVPEEVHQIMRVACNDCHTNNTQYPWYSRVQPVAWWLDHHITDGKGHLNFSEFTNLPIAVQNHKFEEVIEMVEEDEMPLPSYTYFGLHSGANLDEGQKKKLIDWAQAQMDMLEASYPPDSLVMPNRRPAAVSSN